MSNLPARTQLDLTASQLREILLYHPETGEFLWRRAKGNGVYAGDRAGTTNIKSGMAYRYIQLNGKRFQAHRLAWLYVHGEWPLGLIDHVNGDGLDNRIVNLRPATASQNMANARLSNRNSSGEKGVSWNSRAKKWQAFIGVAGKNKNLGQFAVKADAIEAYRSAAQRYFGEFVRSVGAV